jgi:hypothetical protein
VIKPSPRLRRKNTFNVFREAAKLASFDEYPLLRPEVDPQLHLSRNEVDQPFWLVTAKDCVLTLSSGRARILFSDGPTRYFDVDPGEFVYVPAGMPHRVIVQEPGIQLRYKARDFGNEAAVWFCDACGKELYRFGWTQGEMLPQTGYREAVKRFNADGAHRRCKNCGATRAPVDLTPFRWEAVAEALERGDDDED